MKHLWILLLLVLLISRCRPKEENTLISFPGKPMVPSSIQKEHEYLLDQIKRLTLFQDSTGHVAIKLQDLMQHHFMEEEDYVLPPLGLLPTLADGKLPENRKEIVVLTEKLKSQFSHIHAEHQMIIAYMDELKQVALKENHPEIIEFEKELRKHAITEEEILFPSAMLVGEFIKLKSLSAD